MSDALIEKLTCCVLAHLPALPQPKAQVKKDEESPEQGAAEQGPAEEDPNRFCTICQASFNNPLMAQQHYVGKKHKKRLTKQKLMETYGASSTPGEGMESHQPETLEG